MTPSQRKFLDGVKAATSRHFEAEAQTVTTFESEIALLCTLVHAQAETLQPGHADRVLDCLQAFLMRMRSKQQGALSLALQRLAQLQEERETG